MDIMEYRKLSRDFKTKIELMKKTSNEEAMRVFFEMCDFGLENYISIEKARFPDKSIKQIIIEMNDKHEKHKRRERNIWK